MLEDAEIKKQTRRFFFPDILASLFSRFQQSNCSESGNKPRFSPVQIGLAYKIHPLSIWNDHLIAKCFSGARSLCLAVVSSCWRSTAPFFCNDSTAVVSPASASSIRAGRGWRYRTCLHVLTFGTARRNQRCSQCLLIQFGSKIMDTAVYISERCQAARLLRLQLQHRVSFIASAWPSE